MKIAVSTFQGVVAAVFDFANEITVFDIEGKNILNRTVHLIKDPFIPLCTSKLKKLKIEYLICGAVSNPAVILLHHNGIKIIPGIAGNTDAVIKDFLKESLDTKINRLPGFSGYGKGQGKCGGRKRRRAGRKGE